MKLANIKDPSVPMAIVEYAVKHRLKIIEVGTAEEVPSLMKMLNNCISYVRAKGCVEFCVNELREEYSLQQDKRIWRISVIGFAPLK